MSKVRKIVRSSRWWSMWSGGYRMPSTLRQGLLATWLVSLVLVAAPAALAASDVGDPDQGTWSWVEAEYRVEEDGSVVSMPAGTRPDNVFAGFDDDGAAAPEAKISAIVAGTRPDNVFAGSGDSGAAASDARVSGPRIWDEQVAAIRVLQAAAGFDEAISGPRVWDEQVASIRAQQAAAIRALQATAGFDEAVSDPRVWDEQVAAIRAQQAAGSEMASGPRAWDKQVASIRAQRLVTSNKRFNHSAGDYSGMRSYIAAQNAAGTSGCEAC